MYVLGSFVEGVIYGLAQVVSGGFVSLSNARLEGDNSIQSNARGLSMAFFPICSPRA